MIFIQDAPALLINLPIIITLIAATRYIIGFKTWKNYPVLALALAFFFFNEASSSLLINIGLWTLFLAVTLISTLATKLLIRKQKVNYYSRIGLLYLAATIATLITAGVLKAIFPAWTLLSHASFAIAIVLVGSTTEELASLHFKKDGQEFVRRTLTTVLLALISGVLTISPGWNSFIVRHQEILVLVLIADIVLTSWTALRLTELVRFNSIIRNQK